MSELQDQIVATETRLSQLKAERATIEAEATAAKTALVKGEISAADAGTPATKLAAIDAAIAEVGATLADLKKARQAEADGEKKAHEKKVVESLRGEYLALTAKEIKHRKALAAAIVENGEAAYTAALRRVAIERLMKWLDRDAMNGIDTTMPDDFEKAPTVNTLIHGYALVDGFDQANKLEKIRQEYKTKYSV